MYQEVYLGCGLRNERSGMEDYILRKEVLEILKTKYSLKVSMATLKFYVRMGLVKPPVLIHKSGVTGSISYYYKGIPARIVDIEKLSNLGFSLKSIKVLFDKDLVGKYWDMLTFIA